MAIHLEIVTPEGKTFSDSVDGVVVPGVEGELGVLSNHASLVTTLKPGELRYSTGSEEHFLAVGEGVLEVTPTTVSVLSDLAINEADIDEDAVQKALESAEEALKNKEGLDADAEAALQVAIQKSMAQLNVKRKRRSI